MIPTSSQPRRTWPLTLWRFISLMATTLALSASVAHLLELPPKMTYEPTLYVRLHRTLYEEFGKIAGPAEVVAVATTLTLAWWTHRRHRHDFPPNRDRRCRARARPCHLLDRRPAVRVARLLRARQFAIRSVNRGGGAIWLDCCR